MFVDISYTPARSIEAVTEAAYVTFDRARTFAPIVTKETLRTPLRKLFANLELGAVAFSFTCP